MKHTIKDVAAPAGFSIATVSRAINAPHTVNPVTLEKIRAAIDALQFRPSPLGRQLRGERTRLIGVVLPTLANPVFAECLQGIDELAASQGYRLMLMTTQYDAERERHAIETLRAHRVEGLILTVADADTHPLPDELDRDGPLNDLLAMVVMRGLRRARYSVPQDMSILGFDGLPVGELLSPALASVCTPNREIGCAAWRRLMSRIDGADCAESLSLTLPHTLREG